MVEIEVYPGIFNKFYNGERTALITKRRYKIGSPIVLIEVIDDDRTRSGRSIHGTITDIQYLLDCQILSIKF